MKKNGFIEGTIIATLSILLVRAIGIIYVIPFNAIIGEAGGALYGYGYNIYQLFLSIGTAGFPFAISKITSEYNAKGYKKGIYDTYNIATKIILLFSIIIFILLLLFAPNIGRLILGNNVNNSNINDIAFVIRIVSFSILIVPFLSVTRGLLQGHKYISSYSISQVIEQIVRVIVIIVGSFTFTKILHLPLKYSVGVAVSGAFFGGLVSYLYLKVKVTKSKILNKNAKNKDDIAINKKDIIKKIFSYSIPFILISLVNNLYVTIDMILLTRTLYDGLNISTKIGSIIIGIYTTWGVKLNNIILAISTGLVTSLIPNIVSSYTKKDMNDVNSKFNKSIECVLLVIVPMVIFMSLLNKPIWTLFYGKSYYGPLVYKFFVFTALFGGFYTIIVNVLQGLNKYKLVMLTVSLGLVINAILDIPFIYIANNLGFNPSYGAIMADLVGYSISISIALTVLHKKYKFNFKHTFNKLYSFIISWLIFIISILLLEFIIPLNLSNRLIQIPIIIIYGLISFGIYLYINYKNGNLKDILDIDIKKLLRR